MNVHTQTKEKKSLILLFGHYLLIACTTGTCFSNSFFKHQNMAEMIAPGFLRPGHTERMTSSTSYSLRPLSSQLSHHEDSLGIL